MAFSRFLVQKLFRHNRFHLGPLLSFTVILKLILVNGVLHLLLLQILGNVLNWWENGRNYVFLNVLKDNILVSWTNFTVLTDVKSSVDFIQTSSTNPGLQWHIMNLFGIVAALDSSLIILLVVMWTQVLGLEVLLNLISTNKTVIRGLQWLSEKFGALVTDVADLGDGMNESIIVETFELDFVGDTLLIIMGAKCTEDNFLCSSHEWKMIIFKTKIFGL